MLVRRDQPLMFSCLVILLVLIRILFQKKNTSKGISIAAKDGQIEKDVPSVENVSPITNAKDGSQEKEISPIETDYSDLPGLEKTPPCPLSVQNNVNAIVVVTTENDKDLALTKEPVTQDDSVPGANNASMDDSVKLNESEGGAVDGKGSKRKKNGSENSDVEQNDDVFSKQSKTVVHPRIMRSTQEVDLVMANIDDVPVNCTQNADSVLPLQVGANETIDPKYQEWHNAVNKFYSGSDSDSVSDNLSEHGIMDTV